MTAWGFLRGVYTVVRQKTNHRNGFFGLIAFLLLNTPAMTAEPLYDVGHHWHKMSASVAFRDNGYRDRISLYANAKTVSGQTVRGAFKPVPEYLKQALFSGQTFNPFRGLYHSVQVAYQRGQLRHCPFIGVELPLTSAQQTRGWLITAPVAMCLTGGYQRAREPGSHVWLLQRNAQGRYQVMMETAGLVQVIDDPAGNYKQLRTRLYNFHVNPGSSQACGYGSIHWSYREGGYWPTRLQTKINGCQRTMPTLNDAQRLQQTEQGILSGLRRLTGKSVQRLHNGVLRY